MGWGAKPPGGASSWWSQPTPESNNFSAPGHDRMFSGDAEYGPEPTGRMFTTRKKHGWWGPEERYDPDGNRID